MAKKKKKEGNTFTLDGPLMIDEVSEVHKKCVKALEDTNHIALELSNITDCDTAGVQLLYCVLKSVKESNKKVSFSDFPQAIQYAADRIGLEWDV